MEGGINKISELDFIRSPTSERKKRKKTTGRKQNLADEIDFNWTFRIYINEICPGKLYHFLDCSIFFSGSSFLYIHGIPQRPLKVKFEVNSVI